MKRVFSGKDKASHKDQPSKVQPSKVQSSKDHSSKKPQVGKINLHNRLSSSHSKSVPALPTPKTNASHRKSVKFADVLNKSDTKKSPVSPGVTKVTTRRKLNLPSWMKKKKKKSVKHSRPTTEVLPTDGIGISNGAELLKRDGVKNLPKYAASNLLPTDGIGISTSAALLKRDGVKTLPKYAACNLLPMDGIGAGVLCFKKIG